MKKIAQWFKQRLSLWKGRVLNISVPSPELSLVFVDSKGRHWFQYENSLEMPIVRGVALDTAIRFANMKITEKDFKQSVNYGIDLLQKNEKDMVAKLWEVFVSLKQRTEAIGEEESLWLLAACFFVADNEDSTSYDVTVAQAKIAYWKSTPGCRDFFLPKCLKFLDNIQPGYDKHILTYLNKLNQIFTRNQP